MINKNQEETQEEALEKEAEFAFWHYDLFPFVLGDEIRREYADGTVVGKRYGNYRFRPFARLPVEKGRALIAQLEALTVEKRDAEKILNRLFEERLNELLPFSRNVPHKR